MVMVAMHDTTDGNSSASLSMYRTLSALLSLIDEENGLLERREIHRHASFTERKNQALRELMLAQRVHPGLGDSGRCDSLVRELKLSLTKNAMLLQYHIAAVGEVSDIIIAALREAESDGTYSRIEAHGRR